jgi:uncharacterized membrane protein YedE/YeeE
MIEFDWIYGAIGGLLIGTAGSVFLLVNGRILGPSGILGGLVDGSGRENRGERASFIAGLVLFPAIIAMFMDNPGTNITSNLAVIVAAGLLVGIGTRIANGCTGGHGVCGMSRFSVRGLVATGIYIAAGALSVFAFRHVLGVI